MSTTHSSRENGTDRVELPANWIETDTTELARFERDDGAVLRVRTELPTRSAAAFNRGERVDATGTVRVIFHAEPLPSSSSEIHAGGTEQDARDAALAFIREHAEDR
ncbi:MULTISPECIES: hypothetical protein [Halolamina]|uniref:Uncharacterized protein n=1 Tax=Halolamina pelagica TaxID=699431 RepID=A0A1I5U8X3_9EURY|nr:MULTISPECIES: hypothetical protein [Halolamina]NHX37184.1 hypothetical protein [Halolamina sp. R1-12]SFP91741.1 hypothetical protein SAMN05216277_11211 [Halolamina pelagica]